MAPKKNYKQAEETMLEEPTEDWIVPPKSIGEEEPKAREDQDEPESEKEQRSSILFTPKQLEVFLKMNRPDFSELVAEDHLRMRDFNRPNPGTSMVSATERLWMFGLRKWKTIFMPPRLSDIRPWNLPNPT